MKSKLVLVLAATLLVGAVLLPVTGWLRAVLAWVHGLGAWAPFVFAALYVGACVLCVPGSLLTLGAGFLFGVVPGALLVSFASVTGATLAFLLGRYAARDWVSRRISENDRLRSLDEAVAREGWKFVLLTRLSPAFPFNLLNYAFGLTRVSLRAFVLASWLGMAPGTLLYVYLGSLAADLASLGTGGRVRSPAEWAFYALGLVATVAVTVHATRLARKALAGTAQPRATAGR